MATNVKLKTESSRFLSTILVSALESCREGDFGLQEDLGLSLEAMQALDQLKADQIQSISENYVRDVPNLKWFPVDVSKLTRIIEIEAREAQRYVMIDEFLRRGACKEMMAELFGLRSTQVASRKRFLNVPTVKGRLPATTLDEQRRVYDSWLANIAIADNRQRMLVVAKSTGIPLSQIYREVQIIEQVAATAHSNASRICA
ncbi:STY4526/YPO1902 family pathogenicity island replication protein [Marinobacter shengliensis]|uniref:STY4526/YPO1902 family pathogenicity island replication protein n=1 Tax=Marinobacter shengliensis TaxID=1389223 RepID=UPI002573B360|nr:STY4526/YPO1902 family pathogenicity island replication protein [Marinobacter shengliensis]BEH16640.1 hypothetical protein MAALD49_40080 [Marinobacter shengliensis]